jgi:uncharacterized protein YbaR (Trm112 family)
MTGYLDEVFFEPSRWQTAIDIAVDKGIDKRLLQKLCCPNERIKLYYSLREHNYTIAPPHEALIPKDDGTFRTVYVNEGIDRVILSIVNDMLFELCPELIHKSCKSYQKGIGCGKVVQEISQTINKLNGPKIGVKVDLSKYFDSVELPYIDEVFDYIDEKYGKSDIMDAVRTYYHTNTVLDINKNTIEKYSSLRQGCAVAAFLADAVLLDIDSVLSDMNVIYVRYSDDILILGREWEKAFNIMKVMLEEKGLTLNPKKVEQLYKDKWFKFLGFTLKNDKISLSKTRIDNFQEEIIKRTIKNPNKDINCIIHDVHAYLYKGYNEFSWATSVLPIINVDEDILKLNSFVMDAIRASITGKHKIGGLGCITNMPDSTIMRGKGNNVKSNRTTLPHLNGYYTINCMRNDLLTSREVYNTITSQM